MWKVFLLKTIDFLFSDLTLFCVLICTSVLSTAMDLDFFLLDISVALILVLIATLFTNKTNFSFALVLLLGLIIFFLNLIKLTFWGIGFEIADLTALPLIISFSRGIFFGYIKNTFLYGSYLLIVLSCLALIFIRSKNFIESKKIGLPMYFFIRIAMIFIASLLGYAIIYSMFESDSRLNSYLDQKYGQKIQTIQKTSTTYGIDGLNQKVGIYGSSLFGLRSLNKDHTNLSKDVSSDLIVKAAISHKNKYEQKSIKPNVVIVLHESTFNPKDLNYKKLSNLDFEIFNESRFTVTKGNNLVEIFGGNSQRSEFVVMTGLLTEFFVWKQNFPNIFLVEKVKTSLAIEMKKLGYKTIMLYPLSKEFSNSFEAFTKMGIDEIRDIYDFEDLLPVDKKNDSFPIVSDETICQMAEKIMQENKDSPIILFIATMSNHGKHACEYEDKVGCKDLGEVECAKLNDYLDRLRETDNAFSKFTKNLMESSIPTLLIQYGDHKPSFEGYMEIILNKTKSFQNKYVTFYDIKSNFQGNKVGKYENLQINFIPSLIFDLLGINTNEFFLSSSFLRNLCQGNLDNCLRSQDAMRFLESYKKLSVEQISH